MNWVDDGRVNALSITMAAKVSVVIPAYNAARFIGAAIDSVVAQTFQNFEVVVVDDGSTDDTPEIARTYGGRVRCISQPNSGAGAARNAGMRQTIGELVAFLDSDDLWAPEFLERVVAALAAHPKSGGGYAWAQFIDETGTILPGDMRTRPPADMIWQLLSSGCFTLLSMTVFRRPVLEAVGGFNAQLRQSQDWELFVRLASTGISFVHVPEVLVQRRLHRGNLSSNIERSLRWKEEALRAVIATLPPAYRALEPTLRAKAWLNASANLWREGQRHQAVRYFTQAAELFPGWLDQPEAYLQILHRMRPYGSRSTSEFSGALDEIVRQVTAFVHAVFHQPALPKTLMGKERLAVAGLLAAVARMRYRAGHWVDGSLDVLRSVATHPRPLLRGGARRALHGLMNGAHR